MDAMRGFLWLGAAVTGVVGWSGRLECLPLAAFVLVLWRLSRSRLEALGWPRRTTRRRASAGCPRLRPSLVRTPTTRGRPSSSIGAAALLTLPWGLLWSKRFSGSALSRLVRGVALGSILMLPPLGLVSWCESLGGRWRCFAWAWSGGVRARHIGRVRARCAELASVDRAVAHRVHGGVRSSTRRGSTTGSVSRRATDGSPMSTVKAGTIARSRSAKRPRTCTPTSCSFLKGLRGIGRASTEALFVSEATESDQVLLVGALDARAGRASQWTGHRGAGGKPRFWSQRWPAPIGMWAPWRSGHVRSDLGARAWPDRGRRAAMLVCFEQFVSWPAFQTALDDPDVVLAPANLWFADGTNLNGVREVTLWSWAALMGWPVVEAING